MVIRWTWSRNFRWRNRCRITRTSVWSEAFIKFGTTSPRRRSVRSAVSPWSIWLIWPGIKFASCWTIRRCKNWSRTHRRIPPTTLLSRRYDQCALVCVARQYFHRFASHFSIAFCPVGKSVLRISSGKKFLRSRTSSQRVETIEWRVIIFHRRATLGRTRSKYRGRHYCQILATFNHTELRLIELIMYVIRRHVYNSWKIIWLFIILKESIRRLKTPVRRAISASSNLRVCEYLWSWSSFLSEARSKSNAKYECDFSNLRASATYEKSSMRRSYAVRNRALAHLACTSMKMQLHAFDSLYAF